MCEGRGESEIGTVEEQLFFSFQTGIHSCLVFFLFFFRLEIGFPFVCRTMASSLLFPFVGPVVPLVSVSGHGSTPKAKAKLHLEVRFSFLLVDCAFSGVISSWFYFCVSLSWLLSFCIRMDGGKYIVAGCFMVGRWFPHSPSFTIFLPIFPPYLGQGSVLMTRTIVVPKLSHQHRRSWFMVTKRLCQGFPFLLLLFYLFVKLLFINFKN